MVGNLALILKENCEVGAEVIDVDLRCFIWTIFSDKLDILFVVLDIVNLNMSLEHNNQMLLVSIDVERLDNTKFSNLHGVLLKDFVINSFNTVDLIFFDSWFFPLWL